MHRDSLLTELINYQKSSLIRDDEKTKAANFVDFVKNNYHCFERTNMGHITGAAWIVSHDYSQFLLTHHKKLNIWVQLGGHADGNSNIKEVALQEAFEESGITNLTWVLPGIFDIDIHHEPLPNACEYHYDIRYLLKAPPEAKFTISDESHNLAWVPAEKITEYTQKRTILRMAEKINQLRAENI